MSISMLPMKEIIVMNTTTIVRTDLLKLRRIKSTRSKTTKIGPRIADAKHTAKRAKNGACRSLRANLNIPTANAYA